MEQQQIKAGSNSSKKKHKLVHSDLSVVASDFLFLCPVKLSSELIVLYPVLNHICSIFNAEAR